MKFFSFSSPKEYYVLNFSGTAQVWQLWSAQGSKTVEMPPVKPRLPVLAVIPDRYFFYFMPGNLPAKNRKSMTRAVRLQMEHLFPAPHQKESIEIMDTGTHILGIFHGPELDAFLSEHADELAMAGSVTTPFLLSLAVMSHNGITNWRLHNPGDPTILVSGKKLDFFSGDEQELRQRISFHESGSESRVVNTGHLLDNLCTSTVSWNRLRLALPQLESERGQVSSLLKAAVALLIIGLIFCMGDFFKLRNAVKEKHHWEQQLDELYASALGQNYGPDPYGLLLYHADQSSERSVQGLDFIDLMGRLSQAAPESLVIEAVALGMNSGTLRGSLDNYDKMEVFLNNLKAGSGYTFTLDQADSVEGRVNLVLSFRF